METNNTPVQSQQAGLATSAKVLEAVLDAPSVAKQFKNALGEHKDVFISSIIDLYNGDKATLSKCRTNDIVTQCLKAAALQLPINKALGFSYIVAYNNREGGLTPTFVTGYKGYIQLAMRTGQYRTINADVVYEGELVKGNKLTGEIRLDGEKISDKVVGYFAYFELLNGFSKTLYMTVDEMAVYAKKYSPTAGRFSVEDLAKKANETTYSKGSVGWGGNFNEMALKTCIRRLLSKYGYLSVEMQQAVEMDINSEDAAENVRSEMTSAVGATVVDIDEAEIIPQPASPVPQPAKDNTPEIDF